MYTDWATVHTPNTHRKLQHLSPEAVYFLLRDYYGNLETPGAKATSYRGWDCIGRESIHPPIQPDVHPDIHLSTTS